MPRFYFHTQDGDLVCDDEGVELADLEAAKVEAVKLLGEILRSSPDFWASGSLTVQVTTQDGDTVYVVVAKGRAIQ